MGFPATSLSVAVKIRDSPEVRGESGEVSSVIEATFSLALTSMETGLRLPDVTFDEAAAEGTAVPVRAPVTVK